MRILSSFFSGGPHKLDVLYFPWSTPIQSAFPSPPELCSVAVEREREREREFDCLVLVDIKPLSRISPRVGRSVGSLGRMVSLGGNRRPALPSYLIHSLVIGNVLPPRRMVRSHPVMTSAKFLGF